VAFLGEDEAKKKGAEQKQGPKPTALIPKSAVRTDGGKSYVFLVRDAKLERRGVTLGNDRGSDVEVLAGVNSGDSLVSRGPENLQDGETVRVNR